MQLISEEFFKEARHMMTIDEGSRGFPYDDVSGRGVVSKGKVTIGIGRNLTDKPLRPDEKDYLFRNDLRDALDDCKAVFGDVFFRASLPRRLALVNMAFQLGRDKLRKFEDTVAAVLVEDWEAAAKHAADSNWAKKSIDEGGTPNRARRVCRMLREDVNVYRGSLWA